jgi:acyl dehydratase
MSVPPAELPEIQAYVGSADPEMQVAPDVVTQAWIRFWCDALGDDNPIYTDRDAAIAAGFPDVVAPPAALQIWTAPGLRVYGNLGGVAAELQAKLAELGYSSVVGVSTDLEIEQYLVVGDHIRCERKIDSISPEKSTHLGQGTFFVFSSTYYNQRDEVVGTIRSTAFRYRPHAEAVPA